MILFQKQDSMLKHGTKTASCLQMGAMTMGKAGVFVSFLATRLFNSSSVVFDL